MEAGATLALHTPPSKAEKLLFALGSAGGNFVWSYVSSFLLIYYTDSVLLSAGFVGTMMLVTRLADPALNALAGLAIEKTHTRLGKARPWLMLSILPMAVGLLLVFRVPGALGDGGRQAYAAATYFLLMGVGYTLFNLGHWAMLPRLSFDQAERDRIAAGCQIAAFVSGLALSVATTPLLNSRGGYSSQSAWSAVTLGYALVALVFMALCAVYCRERALPAAAERPGEKPASLGAALRVLLKSKYLYLALAISVLETAASGLKMGIGVYYARDVLGNANYYGAMAVSYAVSYIVGIALAPRLFKRFGKRRAMVGGCAVAVLGGLTALLFPYRLAAILFSSVVSSLGHAPLSTARLTFPAQMVDHIEGKTGQRIEGLASSVTSIGSKVGSGLGVALIGWGLAYGGYAAGAAGQSAATITVQIALLTGIPLVANLLKGTLAAFWDLADR